MAKMSNQEAAEAWSKQNQYEGGSGNLSFRGTSLFSYQLEIARIYPREEVVFIIDNCWSRTTNSKHLPLARRYAPYESIYIPAISTPDEMVKAYVERTEELIKSISCSQLYADHHIMNYLSRRETAKELLQKFSLSIPIPPNPRELRFFIITDKEPYRQILLKNPPFEKLKAKWVKQFNLRTIETPEGYRVQEPVTELFLSIPRPTPEEAETYASYYLRNETAATFAQTLSEYLLGSKRHELQRIEQ